MCDYRYTLSFHLTLKFLPSFEFTWLYSGNYLRTTLHQKDQNQLYIFIFIVVGKKKYIYIERERERLQIKPQIVFLITKQGSESFLTIFPWINVKGFITLSIPYFKRQKLHVMVGMTWILFREPKAINPRKSSFLKSVCYHVCFHDFLFKHNGTTVLTLSIFQTKL